MIVVVRQGSINNTVDEVIFNVESYLSCKSYNSVNKVILQHCFEVESNQLVALTEWAL